MNGPAKRFARKMLSFTGVLWLGITVFGCQSGGCLGIAFQVVQSMNAMARLMGAAEPRTSGGYSSVPALRFTGNATTMVPATVNGIAFGPGMLRQSDCSMTEYFVGNYSVTTGTVLTSSVPNYQNYLHSAAQLTTTANQFKNGCVQTMVGAASTSVVYAGQTKSGNVIGAGLDYNNHFYYGTLNLASGTASYTTVGAILTAIAVVAVDLNGDGSLDLVVSDFGSSGGVNGGLWVLMGNGDGTFATPVKYLAGQQPGSLVVDDFDGNKKLDLVVTLNSKTMFVPGNGDGTFGAGVAIAAAGTSYQGAVASGDINGDGNKDLVMSTGVVYLGNGDGTFKAGTAVTANFYGTPVLGDFNNDGKLDVAFSASGGTGVTISLGNGNGTFTAGRSYASIYGSQYMNTLDIDGDGNLDLVVGEGNSGAVGSDLNTAGIYEVLMGNGDGTFQGAAMYPKSTATATLDAMTSTFAVADFNGDGKLDILHTGSSIGLFVLAGDGKGGFTSGGTTLGAKPGGIVAAQMNGDTKVDAVFLDSPYSPTVGVAFGNGDGTFGATKDYTIPGTPTGFDASLATGDFNGDGFADVVVTTQVTSNGNSTMSATYLFLNDGSGGLKAAQLVDLGIAQDALLVADLNGDKKMDLIVADAGSFIGLGGPAGAVKVYLGKGDGTFQAPVSYQPGADIGAIALADMNKDGISDLIVTSSDNSGSNPYLNVYLGKADGTFGAAIKTVELNNYTAGLAVADFDGDGNPDVVQGGCCGQAFTTIFFGKGDGTFGLNYGMANAVSIGSVVATDLNGDGHPDILANPVEGGGSGFEVYLNLYGSVSTLATTTTAVSASPNPATSGTKVTLTAAVAESAGYGTLAGTPTGTVTFLDGTTVLGTGTLASGVATFSTSGLGVGTHSITASYGGDSANAVSTSKAVSEVVSAAATPSFTLALSPMSGSVTGSGNTLTTATVTPVNGFSQAVSFACSGLPSGSTCSFVPALVTPSGAASSTTLTITTVGHASVTMPAAPGRSRGISLALAGCVAGWMFAGVRRRRGMSMKIMGMIAVGGVLFAIAGCGGKGSSATITPVVPVTTAITVTASAGTLSQTATFTLTTQ